MPHFVLALTFIDEPVRVAHDIRRLTISAQLEAVEKITRRLADDLLQTIDGFLDPVDGVLD